MFDGSPGELEKKCYHYCSNSDSDTQFNQENPKVLAVYRIMPKHVVIKEVAAEQHAGDADSCIEKDSEGSESLDNLGFDDFLGKAEAEKHGI